MPGLTHPCSGTILQSTLDGATAGTPQPSGQDDTEAVCPLGLASSGKPPVLCSFLKRISQCVLGGNWCTPRLLGPGSEQG